jgi:thiol-disulfide isomerase/thioredoxin
MGISDVYRCGHCESLAPAYKKAAEHMDGIVMFAAVNCDDPYNRKLCAEFGVQGFPTIKFMKPYNGKVEAIGTSSLENNILIAKSTRAIERRTH